MLIDRDVAIVFHSHCLSPYRYYQDMFYKSQSSLLWSYKISFPLERLHDLIAANVWSDPFSQRVWTEYYPNLPYQVWSVDPRNGGYIELPDIHWECPWCEDTAMVDLVEFTKMYLNEPNSCACTCCGTRIDLGSVSSKHLANDLKQFILGRDIWFDSSDCVDSNF